MLFAWAELRSALAREIRSSHCGPAEQALKDLHHFQRRRFDLPQTL